jgi:hypothetical protein
MSPTYDELNTIKQLLPTNNGEQQTSSSMVT